MKYPVQYGSNIVQYGPNILASAVYCKNHHFILYERIPGFSDDVMGIKERFGIENDVVRVKNKTRNLNYVNPC